MCGRYSFEPTKAFYERFHVSNRLEDIVARYNIAPGQRVPVITHQSPNTVSLMKWGLIPGWAKDEKIGYKMINARAETVASKPSYRKPFVSGRCLVPATGFYEWKKAGARKQPFYIHLRSQPMFAFAGLCETWHSPDDEDIRTFTIITTSPNSLMSAIHNRMPLILDPKDEDAWLNGTTEQAKTLLKEYPAGDMEAYPVSPAVNNARVDAAALIKPLD